jgi:pectin methylesterase-like acyl-CoA thioesterase
MIRADGCSTPAIWSPRELSRGTLAALALSLSAGSYARDYYVDLHGTKPDSFASVQAAIDAVPHGVSEASPTRIFVLPGIYRERIKIPRSKRYLALLGTSANAADTVLTYDLNADSQGEGKPGTTGSASTTLGASNFAAANITFANSTDTPFLLPNSSVQAVAIKIQTDQVVFQNCRFLGYQNTLYVNNGRTYFKDCYVTGDDDFIFGNGTAVFDHCTINVDGTHDGGAITAASTDTTKANGFVFLECTITAKSVRGDAIIDTHGAASASVAPGWFNLGRSWGFVQPGGDSSVIFIRTKIDPAISAEGWIVWTEAEVNPGQDSRFAEFNSMDPAGAPLDVSHRVGWSHQLSASQAAQFTVAHIFGPGNFWFGRGYADPASWPSFWGPRDAKNPNVIPGAVANPTSYSNPGWDPLISTWDPATALAALAVPEQDSARDSRPDKH